MIETNSSALSFAFVIQNKINFFLQPHRNCLAQLLQQVIQIKIGQVIVVRQELPFLTRHFPVISAFTFAKTKVFVVEKSAKVFLLTAIPEMRKH